MNKISFVTKPSYMKSLGRNVSKTLQRSLSDYTSENNIIRCKRELEFPEDDLFSFYEKRLAHFGNKSALASKNVFIYSKSETFEC